VATAKPALKDKSLAPIVVKRIKKGGHGHHGGVWKIAYADFVTAMMAFFLLMWVLGSTTTGDLAGISAYFQNPLRVSIQGGQGSGDATRPMKGGGENLFRTEGQESRADSYSDQRRVSDSQTKEGLKQEKQIFENAKEKIEQEIESDPVLADLKNQVFIAVGVEGLRIQIVDDKNRPMFAVGSAEPLPYTKRLLRTIGKVLSELTNAVRFEGHTDNRQFGNGPAGYGNWELSSERANAARRELVVGGMAEKRTAQVAGYADSLKLNPDDASDPINRRISITVLRNNPLPGEKKPDDKAPTAAPAAQPGKAPDAAAALKSASGGVGSDQQAAAAPGRTPLAPGVSAAPLLPPAQTPAPVVPPSAPALQPPVSVPPREVPAKLPELPSPGVAPAKPSGGTPFYQLPQRPGLSLPSSRSP
jgi:chemotaxis protein MotB